MIKGIGINIDTKRINGSITRFENELAFFQSVGFDYVELPPAGLDVIYWGKIREKQVGRVKKYCLNSSLGILFTPQIR